MTTREKAIAELVNFFKEENSVELLATSVSDEKKSSNKIFRKYKIKDIVFLAIITACTLVTGAIMPLLTSVPLFGIIQLGLGIQFSLFPVIGMMKVRKPFALVFMFPPMMLLIACAIVIEILVLLIFRGYKNDWACVFAGTLYMPMTIPLLYMYYNLFYTVSGNEKSAVSMFIGANNVGVIIGMTLAVMIVCFIGSVIGLIVAKELKKAGKLK